MYIWKVVSWQHRKEGAGIVWQRTVIPVSNQISNKLLLLVGICCRTSLTLEMSQAHWKTFWEEMDEYSFSKGFLVCRHCSICSSSHEYFFFLHCVCNPVYNIDCCKGCWEHGSGIYINGISINGLKEGLQTTLFIQFHYLLLFCLSSFYFYGAIWSRQTSGNSVLPIGNGQFLVYTSYGKGKQNNGILHVYLQRKEKNL